MKQLNSRELGGVSRDLDSAPFLKAWFAESRDEMLRQLVHCPKEDFEHLQGQVITLDQILDKVPEEE